MTSPEEIPEEASAVFSPAVAAMGHRWSSKSEKTSSIGGIGPPAPVEPRSGLVLVPQITVIAASPLPADSDGSMFLLPAENHVHITSGHAVSTGPQDDSIRWALPSDEDDHDGDVADSHDDGEGHCDLHSVYGGQECATPRASRQNFMELIMDSSPQVHCSMVRRNASFLAAGPGASGSDSDSASPVSSCDECSPAPHAAATLDPLEHQWMLWASDADWDGLSGPLAAEPTLVLKRDFVTGFTCLHWAAKQGKPELLALLVNFARRHTVPVDVNARSGAGGYTPLHLAAMHDHAEVVKLLVGVYDADVELRDYSGKKAGQYLLAGGSTSVDIQDIMGGLSSGGDDTNDSDGQSADGQTADGRVGVRWRLSRALQPRLKPLRLLGHSTSDVGAHSGGGGGSGDSSDDSDGQSADGQTVDGQVGVRWRLSRALQPRLKPLRLLGHSASDVGTHSGSGGRRHRLRPVYRLSSLGRTRPHKPQKRRSNRTSHVLTGTPAATALPESTPKSNLLKL